MSKNLFNRLISALKYKLKLFQKFLQSVKPVLRENVLEIHELKKMFAIILIDLKIQIYNFIVLDCSVSRNS